MDVTQVVEMVKARLGISTSVRDSYLTAIVNGILQELTGSYGLTLEVDNSWHLMFVADYATWQYQSVVEPAHSPAGRVPLSMPRHLQFRLHNLLIKQQAGDADV